MSGKSGRKAATCPSKLKQCCQVSERCSHWEGGQNVQVSSGKRTHSSFNAKCPIAGILAERGI